MTIYIAVLGASWRWMAGQLLVSGLAALSVCQDLASRVRLGAAFWFLISLAFGISALGTAIRSNLRFGPAICLLVLCSETVLIFWRVLRSRSKEKSR